MKQIRAQLLGRFQLVCNERAVEIPQARLQSLIAYLLLHLDSPQPRQHLAFLFWPDTLEKQAHTNLRNLLYQLRAVWPEVEQFLSLGRNHISWQPEVAVTLDVADFEAAIREVEAGANLLEPLQRARLLYTGDFLPALWEEWVIPERERLRLLFHKVIDRLVVHYSESGQYRSAISYAEELLQLDPLREESYRRLMRLYAATHDRARALQSYHQCVAILERELDVEPDEVTTALYQNLLMGKLGDSNTTGLRAASTDPTLGAEVAAAAIGVPVSEESKESRSAPLRNFPTQLTPLVGRTRELSEVVAQLVEPDCRLLTLMGPGGIGKTRLAIAAAEITRTRHEFSDGVYFVGLAPMTAPEMMASALTSALGISLHEEESLQSQLLYHLRPLRALLLLDNYEHLLPDIALVNELLQVAPNIKLLVTSREALNLRAEVRFAVPGLSYPSAHDAPAQEQRDLEEAVDYGAVDLFRRVAERLQPDFQVNQSTSAEINRICQLVDGSPLALEMAAGWTRMYEVDSIRAQIEEDLDFLVAQTRDSLPRHQSMRVVLEHSWQLLSPFEQNILLSLSVFAGNFAINAAVTVTGAAEWQLASLLDKTLLQRMGRRFSLHELVRRFAAEKLEELVAHPQKSREAATIYQVRERHARYYLGLLVKQAPNLFGKQPAQAVRELTGELDNLRAAWRWASETQSVDLLSESLTIFARFYERCALVSEAAELLAQAIQPLHQAPRGDLPAEAREALLARLLAQRADILFQMDEGQQAQSVALAAERRAATLDANVADALLARAHAYLTLSRANRAQIQHDTARDQLSRALSLINSMSNTSSKGDWLRAQIYNELGNVHRIKGEYVKAFEWQKQAYDLAQELGDLDAMAKVQFDIGLIHWDTWQIEEVIATCRQTLKLEEQLGNRSLQARAIVMMGYSYHRLGQLSLAEKYLEHGLQVAEAMGLRRYIAECHQMLGSFYIEKGLYEQAASYLLKATELYRELELPLKAMECSIGFASLAENLGQYEDARDHLMSCFENYKSLQYQRGMIDVGSSLGRIFRLMGEDALAQEYLDFVIYASKEEEVQHLLPLACIERSLVALAQGNYAAAEAFCNEGLQALRFNEKSDNAFQGRLLYFQGRCVLARIQSSSGQGDRASIAQGLASLLERAETELERAIIHFELWRLTGAREQAERALFFYRQRYQQKPRHEYTQRIQELEAILTY